MAQHARLQGMIGDITRDAMGCWRVPAKGTREEKEHAIVQLAVMVSRDDQRIARPLIAVFREGGFDAAIAYLNDPKNQL